MDKRIEGGGKVRMGAAEKPGTGAENGQRARGIDRVVHILDYLYRQGRPLRVNEIAKGIGAPRSTVYEIADHLLEEQMLEVFDDEGRVFLGRRLYFYGLAYADRFDLTREASKHLKILTEKTGETSQLCVMQGNQYAVIMMDHGVRHFKISSNVGETIPLPWTASGRLLVSHLTDGDVLKLIPERDFILPDGRPLPTKEFLDQVRAAGDVGFFSCDTIVDSYTHCFAASVINEKRECVATLCLVVPREDAYRRFDALKSALTGEAEALSNVLRGGRSA
jgi:DNA-binding IclR family transcriptional regulator